MTAKSKSRRKRVPPGTRIRLDTASRTERLESLQFASDYNHCRGKLDEFRRQCEATGKDAFEELAHASAHNWTVANRIKRLKAKGAATVMAAAQKSYAKIAKDVAKAGTVKAVAIDAQARKRKVRGRSERTIRRALKKTRL